MNKTETNVIAPVVVPQTQVLTETEKRTGHYTDVPLKKTVPALNTRVITSNNLYQDRYDSPRNFFSNKEIKRQINYKESQLGLNDGKNDL